MADPFVIEYQIDGRKFPSLDGGLLYLSKKLDIGKPGIKRVLKSEFRRFMEEIATVMEAKHSGAYPGGTTQTSLSARSGRGVKSIRKSIVVRGGSLEDTEAGIGGASYLRTHEGLPPNYRTIIKPKSGKYLTIPLKAALNANGTPKKPRARDWGSKKDGIFVIQTKSGYKFIAKKSRRKVVFLYLLVGPGEKIKQIEFTKGKGGGRGSGVGPTRLGLREAAEKRLTKFSDRLAKSILLEMRKT